MTVPASGVFLSVRRGTLTDAQAILDCLRSAFEPYRAMYTDEAFADTVLTPETIDKRLSEMCVLVATSSAGEIIGTVSLSVVNSEEGHIRGMAVRPDWQGQGVAESLLRAVESELRERKCSRISLDTTEPLLRAIRFYERHGFRPSGVVADFFRMRLFEYVKEI